MGLVIKKTIKL